MKFSVTGTEWLLFTLFFTLFTSLGIWQIMRADEKRGIQEIINTRSQLAPLDLNQAVDADILQYQRLKVTGQFVQSGQLLIDNIRFGKQIGYHVISPLKIAGSDKAILVNRGWVAQGESRQQFPEVDLPTGQITLEGIMRTPSALPFVESSTTPLSNSANFNLWLYLDLKRYQQESKLALLPFALYQENDSGDGLQRQWPAYKAKVGMHIGYAIQWFALALIVTWILIWQGRKRGQLSQPTADNRWKTA